MKIILTSLLILIVSVSILHSNLIDKWMYWFDDDLDNATITTLNEPSGILELDLLVDVETPNLAEGLHKISFMFHDTAGYWNILSKYFFYLPDKYAKLTGYEYWFDANKSQKVVVNFSATNTYLLENQFNASSLAPGLHFLTIRFKTQTNMYSAPLVRAFYRSVTMPGENKIVAYQYWFGDSSANGATVNANAKEFLLDEGIDFANLPLGLNKFTIRFKDAGGVWSSPIVKFFFNSGVTNFMADNKIITYQYWFSHDKGNIKTQNIQGIQSFILDEQFDTEDLPVGLNSVSIRFKDEYGLWSVPITKYFFNTGIPVLTADNRIKAYRYWFDDDIENATVNEFKNPLPEIDFANNLQIPTLDEEQNYTFGIQFLDESGFWSVPVIQQFYFDENGIAAPYLIAPPNNHNEGATAFTLQWADQPAAERYQLQVSTKQDFTTKLVDKNDIEELSKDVVEHELDELTLGYKYFWRVRSIKGANFSPWSEEWNFITGFASHNIALTAGWNMTSTYINPPNPDIENFLAPVADDIVIVKNNFGQIYYPEFGINDIGNWNIYEGYQIYTKKATNLVIQGLKIVPSDNPINLNFGWNIVAYIKPEPQNIEDALKSLTDDEALIIAKNNFGQIYYPMFGINDIENMLPGQGYQIYLIKSSTLLYFNN